jgi:hypothetical protein
MWTEVERCGQRWRYVDRRGEMWTEMERCGQRWRDVDRVEQNITANFFF